MGNSAKRDARAAKDAERQRQALQLRIAGATYDQIADALGFTDRSNARKAIQRALLAIIEEPAEEVLRLEISRLDALLFGVWKAAKGGNVQAIDRALRIMERRAAYLGLDAPKKSELTGKDGGPIEADLSGLSDEKIDAVIAALSASVADEGTASLGSEGGEGS